MDESIPEPPAANKFSTPAWLIALLPWFFNECALYQANSPAPKFHASIAYVTELAKSVNPGYSAALLGGALASSGIMIWLYRMNHPSSGSRRISAFGDHLSKLLARLITRLDIDDGVAFVEDGRLRDTHLDASMFAGLALAIYVAFGVVPIAAAALLYVLQWLSLAGWTFGFLCFWFDRYRVPVISIALLWAVLVTSLARNAHYYFVEPGTSGPQPAIAADIFKGPDGKVLPRVVIVSSEGGGIHAEAWTARVLVGLVERLGGKYPVMDSVRLLSGTSGGSVGNMFFQTLYDRPDHLTDEACRDDVVFESRNGTGLDDIAHGIVYHDIRRPLYPYIAYSNWDRGNSLELAWRRMLDDIGAIEGIHKDKSKHPECQSGGRGERTLDELSADAHNGRRPLLVFNATLADSGWPLAIANFGLPEERGVRVFHERYHKNLRLTTAVRLSASFPYVLPSPRVIMCDHPGLCFVPQDQPAGELAVIDGGLYDNYGVVGAYQALSEATSNFTNYPAKVLWLQIRSGPSDDENPSDDKPNPLASGAAGPLFTLYQVRGTGQAKRIDELTYDAMLQSNNMLTVVPIEYPSSEQPLSWKLTGSQARDIDRAWFGTWVNHNKTRGVADRVVPLVEAFFKD